MQTIRTVFLIILLAGATTASALPPDMQAPSVSLYDLRIVELNPDTQTFAVRLRVKNPNLAAIPLRQLRYWIELNGQEIVHGRNDHPVILPGLGEAIVDMRAVASMPTVIQQLDDMMRNGTLAASYRIHGEARLGNGAIAIPFEQGGSIDLQQLMGIAPPPSTPAPPKTI